MENSEFTNPYRPGAGHMPLHLAGRAAEVATFEHLLKQQVILTNALITGLRGVGKTVLLETLKPVAISKGWLWVGGTELSESVSVSEDRLIVRLLADLSLVTSGIAQLELDDSAPGFAPGSPKNLTWNYHKLSEMYEETPGLHSDKLKAVLEAVAIAVKHLGKKGIVFAYDEAQNLGDNSAKDRYPMSLLLDVFQSLQRKGIPFMLALAGLPTMQTRLTEVRTYTERMFHVILLDRLSSADTREAIEKPREINNCPFPFSDESIQTVCEISGGYPFFIQFICKETYDTWVQQHQTDGALSAIPVNEILHKLDSDFFAGRWGLVTDRQRDLLRVVAQMGINDGEFTVNEIVSSSERFLIKPFTGTRVSAILTSLIKLGLIFRTRHGKYCFAVPMFGQFIMRHLKDTVDLVWGDS